MVLEMNKYQIAHWLRDQYLIYIGKVVEEHIYVCELCSESLFLQDTGYHHFYKEHRAWFDLKWIRNRPNYKSEKRYKEKKEYKKLYNTDQEFITILKDNKIYEKESRLLLCPDCYHYSVDYSKSFSWWCNNCLKTINYSELKLDLSDEDKYSVYKLAGIDALSVLTNESLNNIKEFVSSYFKKCCISKKDKCLYFDFLNRSG